MGCAASHFFWDLLGSLPPSLSGEGALGVIEVLENLEDLDIKIKKSPTGDFFILS